MDVPGAEQPPQGRQQHRVIDGDGVVACVMHEEEGVQLVARSLVPQELRQLPLQRLESSVTGEEAAIVLQCS